MPLTNKPLEPVFLTVKLPLLITLPSTVKAAAELSSNKFPALSTVPLIVKPLEPLLINVELPLFV